MASTSPLQPFHPGGVNIKHSALPGRGPAQELPLCLEAPEQSCLCSHLGSAGSLLLPSMQSFRRAAVLWCPDRVLAAQQPHYHSIISPEIASRSCGPLDVCAVEPCPEPCSELPFVAMPLVLLCWGFWAAWGFWATCRAASRALRSSGLSSPASYRIASISSFVCKKGCC